MSDAHTPDPLCPTKRADRADEWDRIAEGMKAEAEDFRRAIQKKERKRLRAQVEALYTILHDDPSSRSGALVDWVRLSAVLDLLGGDDG